MELATDLVEPIRTLRKNGNGPRAIPIQLRAFKLHGLLQIAAATSGLAVEKLVTLDKRAKRTAARHLYMWLAHRFTAHAYATIGKLVLRMDHTTVRHAVIRVQAVVDQNKEHMPTDADSPEAWAAAIWSVWGYDTYKAKSREKKQLHYAINSDEYRKRALARYRRIKQQQEAA